MRDIDYVQLRKRLLCGGVAPKYVKIVFQENLLLVKSQLTPMPTALKSMIPDG